MPPPLQFRTYYDPVKWDRIFENLQTFWIRGTPIRMNEEHEGYIQLTGSPPERDNVVCCAGSVSSPYIALHFTEYCKDGMELCQGYMLLGTSSCNAFAEENRGYLNLEVWFNNGEEISCFPPPYFVELLETEHSFNDGEMYCCNNP